MKPNDYIVTKDLKSLDSDLKVMLELSLPSSDWEFINNLSEGNYDKIKCSNNDKIVNKGILNIICNEKDKIKAISYVWAMRYKNKSQPRVYNKDLLLIDNEEVKMKNDNQERKE